MVSACSEAFPLNSVVCVFDGSSREEVVSMSAGLSFVSSVSEGDLSCAGNVP